MLIDSSGGDGAAVAVAAADDNDGGTTCMALCMQSAFFLCHLGSLEVPPGLFLHIPLCDSDNTK